MSNNRIVLPGIALLLVTIQNACTADTARAKMPRDSHTQGICFPPAGQGLEVQDQRGSQQVGLKPEVIGRLKGKASRWALWRHGYLVHVEGHFNTNQEVKSLRKTWHALTVGAAIKQGKIPSYNQRISQWVDLHDPNNPHRAVDGNPYHNGATWWHVMTQSTGFDYPYDSYPAYQPGQIWTYSDKNPRHLTDALAKAYGKRDHYDNYKDVVKQAYFRAIGMRGWDATGNHDGTRFHFDLEDMGRLGLLVMARGRWNGTELIPQWFVEELETKRTYGMLVNYNGPDDGAISWDPAVYPECPYGYMTWVNTDQDLYPGADAAWAYGAGAGGTYILWNHRNGIVFAGVAVKSGPTSNGIPHIIERNIIGPNPLVAKYLGNIGTFAKWAKIEIEMIGPDSQGAGNPNPFDLLVDVTFAGPSAQEYSVPGFYDGDGNGDMDGNIWKVRFAADELGAWTFESSSSDDQLDGYRGSFEVICPPSGATDFYKWGRLEYIGTAENKIRYLKFRDGPYWLKAGCDDPENFLGNFSNYDTPEKRKAAIDYLADRGVNSQYIMTHNLGGDDQDTWPWLGPTAEKAKSNAGHSARFELPRMQQWTQLFEYMQRKGICVYLVLEDDSAWTDYDHERYYREMIARFGYLPALLFNFNEEYNENYKLSAALSYMQLLKDTDPYDHPRGIHNVNSVNNQYVDAHQVDFTSIQTDGGDPLKHNKMAIDWINRCISRSKRVLMTGFDEPRPLLDRKNWWSAYMGGGVLEVHVDRPYDRPVWAWEPAWSQIGGARKFMESLEFWKMAPENSLVVSGQAFCLANPGEQYALYLPAGGRVIVELAPNVTYRYSWWRATNDRNGSFQDGGVCGGGQQTFSAPGSGDWALRIVKKGRSRNPDDYTWSRIGSKNSNALFPQIKNN